MASVNISLSDQMQKYINDRLSEGQYSDTSEYFQDLVRHDQDRRAQERLEKLLLDGLESGEPIDMSAEYVREKRADLMLKIEATQGDVG